jgi:hypothetical protein
MLSSSVLETVKSCILPASAWLVQLVDQLFTGCQQLQGVYQLVTLYQVLILYLVSALLGVLGVT